MYLHLGDDRRVPAADIVAIYDAAMFRAPRAACEENRRVLLRTVGADVESPETAELSELQDPRIQSVIVTDKRIYFSAISPVTLGRRCANPLARTHVLLEARP